MEQRGAGGQVGVRRLRIGPQRRALDIAVGAPESGGQFGDAGAGLAVRDSAAVGDALHRIGDRYDEYSQAAVRFFEDKLDFRRAFLRAAERIGIG